MSITTLSQTIPKACQTTIIVRKRIEYQTETAKTIKGTSPEEEGNGALSLLYYTLKSEGFQLKKRLKQQLAPGLLFSYFQSMYQP